jgi:hypothetical protein
MPRPRGNPSGSEDPVRWRWTVPHISTPCQGSRQEPLARWPASLLALRLDVDKELADAVDVAMKSLFSLVG